MPSAWALDMHSDVTTLVSRLWELQVVLTPIDAMAALAQARSWLDHVDTAQAMGAHGSRRPTLSPARSPSRSASIAHMAGGEGSPRHRALSLHSSLVGEPTGDGPFLPGTGAGGRRGSNGAGVPSADDGMPKMPSIVQHAGWGIRVGMFDRNGGPAYDDDTSLLGTMSANAQTARVLGDAAVAFEKQLREGVAATIREHGGGAASTSATTPRGRRGSKAMADGEDSKRVSDRQSMEKGGAGAHQGGQNKRPPIAQGDDKSHSAESSTTGGWGRRPSLLTTTVAGMKPKARELHRMLAAALSMGGSEVEDHVMQTARREAEEMVSRDALKRATKTQVRQWMRANAPAAGAGGGKKGGGGGGSGGGGGGGGGGGKAGDDGDEGDTGR